MKRKALLLLIPLVAGGLAGCNQNEPNPPAPQCDSATVALDKQTASIAVGGTIQLNASINIEDCPVTWSSSNEAVASVNQNGLVTGKAEGTANIAANGVVCVVTVTNDGPVVVHVTGVEFKSATYDVKPGNSINVLAEVTPSNATDKKITYTLKDASPADCATISSNIVTAVKEGTVKVVATTSDGGFTAEATVVISADAPDPEPVHAGTEADPYDVNDAVIIGNKLAAGAKTENDVFIKGVAETADYLANKGGSYSFEIGQGFLCYSLKNGADGKAFADGDIAVGDEVLVKAKITKFHQDASGDKPERTILETSGGYVVNVKKPGEGEPVSIKEIKAGPTEVEQGTELHASDYTLTINMSGGGTKDVLATGIIVDTSVVGDNVSLTLQYTGLQDFVTTIKVNAPAAKVVGDFYKVKSQADITAGTYLLVWEGTWTPAEGDPVKQTRVFTGIDAANDFVLATNDNGHIVANSDFIKVELEEMTGGFAFKVVGGTNDGKYMYGTSGSNGLKFGTDKKLHTIEHKSERDVIVCDSTYLSYNTNTNDQRFRYYKADTQKPVQLYKMHEGEPAELVSISADSSQVKKEYYVGDSLDTTNLVVTAHYDDESEKVITSGYTINPESFQVVGDEIPVTISYNGKSADPFNVKVNEARTLVSIKFGGSMTDLEYNVGESYNPAGLKVVGVYNDSSEDDLDAKDYTLSCNPEKAALGDTSVVVTGTVQGFEPITTTVTGITVSEITPIVLPGTYYIGSNGKYLVKNSDSSKQPLCVATTDEATPFDFILQTGTSDQYKIKVHGEDSYLYLTATNNGVKIGKTQMIWTIGEGTCKDIVGGYNLTAKDSSNAVRVLTCYQGTDFRCYELKDDGSATNRTDNTFLTAAVEKTLESISVTSQPTKDSYYVGETFDPAGLVVKAHYVWDGGSEDKEITDYSLSVSGAFVEGDVGTKTITVTFGEKTTTFDVTVSVRTATLVSITIDGELETTEYHPGETYSVAGLSVTAHYSDESTADLPAVAIILDKTTAALGDTKITANASYEGKDASKDFDVSVTEQEILTPITLSTTGGTKASAAKVNEVDAIKCGTGSDPGAMVMSLPKNTEKVVFHAVAWSGENMSLKVSNGDTEIDTYAITADTGLSGASTSYTLAETDLSKFVITINFASPLEAATDLKIEAVNGKRFAVWDAGVKVFQKEIKKVEITDYPKIIEQNAEISKEDVKLKVTYADDTFDLEVMPESLVYSTAALGETTLVAVFSGHNSEAVNFKVIEESVKPVELTSLTFPDANSENNKKSGYENSWKAIDAAGNEYTINNFNNNNWSGGWTYIKCGSKNGDSTGTILTGIISNQVSAIKINLSAITAANVTSIKLYSSVSGDFSDAVEEGSFNTVTGDQTLNLASPKTNCSYKLEIVCTKGSNGMVTFTALTILGFEL